MAIYESQFSGQEIDEAIKKLSEPLDIVNGGTGAATVNEAKTNLGINITGIGCTTETWTFTTKTGTTFTKKVIVQNG